MILDDISLLLSGGGVTATIYKGFLPDTPDSAVALYETPGEVPDQSGTPYDYLTFQVRCRGNPGDYVSVRVLMDQCYRILHNSVPTDYSSPPAGKYIYCFAVQSGPTPMGRDANGRPELVWNFKAMRERLG